MEYKRKTRQMPEQQKQRISAALKGRRLSAETKAAISAGQKAAWAKIPYNIGSEDNGEKNTQKNENKV